MQREWAQNPVTKEFLKSLKDDREAAKESWAAEQFVAATAEGTMMQNAAALGGVRVLEQIIENLEALSNIEEGEEA